MSEFNINLTNNNLEQSIPRNFTSIPFQSRGHGVAVVTHSPPTSEVGGSNPEPYVAKMVVPYQCSAVYSTEP